ncbi:MAG TPA: outer membrane protein assembly factor BamD [Blastocatellia bacterium]|nr:outer membrane protein assembly factor BamD [Blastocatellia bacterium]
MSGMKFFAKTLVPVIVLVTSIATATAAQGPGKPMAPPRDPAMEIAAKHNLDVARWYLTKRKAYEGARDRLQEIIDTYPDFSRMDEVIFLMGEAHLKLNKNERAVDYYNKLLKVYPDSEFAKKARARLDELKAESEKKGADS